MVGVEFKMKLLLLKVALIFMFILQFSSASTWEENEQTKDYASKVFGYSFIIETLKLCNEWPLAVKFEEHFRGQWELAILANIISFEDYFEIRSYYVLEARKAAKSPGYIPGAAVCSSFHEFASIWVD